MDSHVTSKQKIIIAVILMIVSLGAVAAIAQSLLRSHRSGEDYCKLADEAQQTQNKTPAQEQELSYYTAKCIGLTQ